MLLIESYLQKRSRRDKFIIGTIKLRSFCEFYKYPKFAVGSLSSVTFEKTIRGDL
jgi:hypothetical protein